MRAIRSCFSKPFSAIAGRLWHPFRWRQTAVATAPEDVAMERETRLALFEAELRGLLSSGIEHDFVRFSNAARDDQYVLYMRDAGAVRAEAGPVRKGAATALGCLGFSAGTRTYTREQVPPDARRLACLTELVFGAAFGPTEDLTVLVLAR